MPMSDRAAQFSPFAAHTGYDDAIEETARRTEEKHELSEEEADVLNRALQDLKERIAEKPLVTICYFLPDERKAGGSYQTISGRLRRIDEGNRFLEFMDRTRISMDRIMWIRPQRAQPWTQERKNQIHD